MNTRASRALRGAACAAIATVTAATAHTLGGGAPPSPLFCVVLFALAAPLATALASARPARWRTVLAVGASQTLFHVAFTLLGDIGASPFSAAEGLGATRGHAHGAVTMWATDAAAHLPADVTPLHADMTLGHVIAALVTIAFVCRGEAALAAIAAWMVRKAAVPAVGPVFPSVPRRVDALPSLPRAELILPPGLGRRGPPFVLSSPIAA